MGSYPTAVSNPPNRFSIHRPRLIVAHRFRCCASISRSRALLPLHLPTPVPETFSARTVLAFFAFLFTALHRQVGFYLPGKCFCVKCFKGNSTKYATSHRAHFFSENMGSDFFLLARLHHKISADGEDGNAKSKHSGNVTFIPSLVLPVFPKQKQPGLIRHVRQQKFDCFGGRGWWVDRVVEYQHASMCDLNRRFLRFGVELNTNTTSQ